MIYDRVTWSELHSPLKICLHAQIELTLLIEKMVNTISNFFQLEKKNKLPKK